MTTIHDGSADDRSPEEDLVENVALGVVLLSPVVFIYMLFVKPSTYGKLHQSKESTMNVLLPSSISWFLFEVPNLIWVVYGVLHSDDAVFGIPNKILLACFTVHYVNRTVIYPFTVMSPTSKTPITITILATCYTTVNGFLQALSLCRHQRYPSGYEYSMQFVFGILIMAAGFAINCISDRQLCQLRKENKGYQIPRGKLFQFISTPNLMGEVMEWIGYGIAASNMPAFSFTVWAMANLVPRALAQHQWYKTKFEEYPSDRKAIIPFVY